MADLEEPRDEIPADELPDNAADETQVVARKRAAGRRDQRLRNTLVGILSVRDGREWVWDLLERCNVYSQSFVQGEPDATAFNEGRRSVGNRLLAEIVRADPQAMITMMKEFGG